MGLVVRDHLMVLLRRALARRPGGPEDDITYEDLNRQFVSAAARTMVSEQQMAVLQVCCFPPVYVEGVGVSLSLSLFFSLSLSLSVCVCVCV